MRRGRSRCSYRPTAAARASSRSLPHTPRSGSYDARRLARAAYAVQAAPALPFVRMTTRSRPSSRARETPMAIVGAETAGVAAGGPRSSAPDWGEVRREALRATGFHPCLAQLLTAPGQYETSYSVHPSVIHAYASAFLTPVVRNGSPSSLISMKSRLPLATYDRRAIHSQECRSVTA